MSQVDTANKVEIGKVVGVWGVKGWIKIHSFCRDRASIADYSVWYLRSKPQRKSKQAESTATVSETPFKVLQCKEQGKGIVAYLENISDRDAAENLVGKAIYIDESDLPALPQGEYYWRQLIGLSVRNTAGDSLGIVNSIIETGANDVLVIKRSVDANSAESNSADILVPYIDSAIAEVDVDRGEMVVEWDPAYLDE